MASELIENDILEIDPNYDVETKNWLLKNYDPMYLITRFQNMEEDANTYGTKFKKLFNALYQSILNGTFSKKVTDSNGNVTENGISEDELKVLNYVLRYKKGFYEKGQQIVSIKEDGVGHFNLLDPGYYLIEVSGPGQEGGTDFADKNTLGGDNYYENVLTKNRKWCSEDGKITLWLGSRMSWRIKIEAKNVKTQNFGGKFELNDKNVFLFKSTYTKDDVVTPDDVSSTFEESSENHYYSSNDGNGEKISSLKQLRNNTVIYDKKGKDYQEKVFLNISKDELDDNSTQCYKYLDYTTANFWDKFSLDNFDILTEVNDFAKIILSINGYRLCIDTNNEEFKTQIYSYLKICTNLHDVDDTNINVLHSEIGSYYQKILKKKIRNESAYLISDFYLKTLYRSSAAYQSYFSKIAQIKNKGYYYLDAGHAYVIVNLRKDDVGRFDYTVSSSITSISKQNVLSITANTGGKSNQTANNKDTTDLNEKLEFKIGEKSIYDDNVGNRGTLGSCVVSWHRNTTTMLGGGGKGSGVKRNLYDNLYWQDAEKGYIKITYLGDESLDLVNVKGLSSNNDEVELHVLFANYDGNTAKFLNEGKLPKNSSLPLEFRRKVDTFKGNSIISLTAADDVTKLSGASNLNKTLYRHGNIYRDYVECCASDLTFEMNNYPNGHFFDYDKTDDFKITSFSDGFLKGPSDLAVGISYTNQNLDLNVDLLSQYNNAVVEDEDNFDAIKKKTAFSVSCNNFYVISSLQEVYQLTVSYKNSLDLEQITDYFDTAKVIYSAQQSVKIDHSTMNLFFDRGKPYASNKYTEKYVIENKKYKLAGGQKVMLRFFFTSPRVRVSKSLSNFPASTNFTELCNEACNDTDFQYYFDPRKEDKDGNTCWETTKSYLKTFYGEDTDSFEYVEFFMPSYSLNLNVLIEKNTYKMTLLSDLYEVLSQSFINSKTEYEFYEPVPVLCSMPSYSRVSNLYITASDQAKVTEENKDNDRWYVVKPKDFLDYESFVSFGSAYDELDLIKSAENSRQVYSILSKEIRPIYGSEFSNVFHNEFVLSSVRESFLSDEVKSSSSCNGFYIVSTVLRQNYVKQVIDENFVYTFSMPQCDMQIRLTAAILPFSKLLLLENGQASNVRLFKNCTLVAFMSGGATGNGGNGAASTVSSQGTTSQGGYGGDGYIGGNSGDSGSNAVSDRPYVDTWKGFIPTGFSIYVFYAGGITYGGNGFLSCGALGSKGDSAYNTHHNITTKMYSIIDANQVTFLYTGTIFLGTISFKNEGTNNQQVVLTCKSGVQGNDGINGTSGAGIYYLNGEGGGNGTPTYLLCSNKNVSMSEHNAAISEIYGNDNIENDFKTDRIGIKAIFLGGGIRGQAYTHGNEFREHVKFFGIPPYLDFGSEYDYDISENLNKVKSTDPKFRYAFTTENAYTNSENYKKSTQFTMSSGLRYRCGLESHPSQGISWSAYEASLLGYSPSSTKLYALFNTKGFWKDVKSAYNQTAVQHYIEMRISGYSALSYQSGLLMLYCLNETAKDGRNAKQTIDDYKCIDDAVSNYHKIGDYFEFRIPDDKLSEVVNLWK